METYAGRRLKIAEIAPCWLPVPPRGYGGTELVIANITSGLVERGHDVTLFASGDSDTKAQLVPYYDVAPGTVGMVENPFFELPHVLNAYSHAAEFDVIHDHSFPFGPSIAAHLASPPVVHTLHGPPWYPQVRPVYELIARRLHFVAISEAQRAGMEELNHAATIHHGIDVDAFPMRTDKDGYLLFVGRISPEKSPHLAVEVAHRLDRRLVMAVKMAEPAEKAYFEAEVRPRLRGDEEIHFEVTHEEKVELYAGAACTLMPIQWPEPFGLVMIESMACGTPVVAFRMGAAPEIIEHGETGFIAGDLDEFTGFVARADSLDPAACRRRVEEKFSIGAMVNAYEKLFRSLLP